MKSIKHLISYRRYRDKISFFSIGAVNTAFGYFAGILLLSNLKDYLTVFYISILSSIISVLFSFTTYKILHFKNTAETSKQLMKALLVYSGLFAFNAIFLTYLIADFGLNIELSQLIITITSVLILYILHNQYTFKKHS